MWARVLNAALGVWLMAAPAVLGYGEPLSASDRIVGPLVFSFAVMAIWAVLRPLRWLNLVLGIWLVLAPWVLVSPWHGAINSILVGIVMILLALIKGQIKQPLGGGWSYLWRA